MSKHSPAPWIHVIDGSEYLKDANGEILVCDTEYYPYVSLNSADWQLVAAAPELLEALQLCFDYPADVFDIPDDEPFTMTVLGSHLKLVRQAIKKATGAE
ncbi:MAG TPA: hypothetical protein VHL10_08125 [Nitrososphaera sp.]|jgi:hypothetical protein|nr:hypothetical protein [Nitrososphaera sp.]